MIKPKTNGEIVLLLTTKETITDYQFEPNYSACIQAKVNVNLARKSILSN